MYVIPLTPTPNQTFPCTIPLNDGNTPFQFDLTYNDAGEYWQLTLTDLSTAEVKVTNLPLLSSDYDFGNIFHQLGYKNIGRCYIVNIDKDQKSMPDADNLGSSYVMVWGDNYE